MEPVHDLHFERIRADAEPAARMLTAMTVELNALYARIDGELASIPATPEQMWEPDGSFLVGSSDGEAVCCGGVKRLGEGLAEIKRMFVVPEARGRGYARLLLAELEAEARRLGYRRVRLDTGAEQPAARTIYESSGYRSIPAYNDNPYAAWWFEREL